MGRTAAALGLVVTAWVQDPVCAQRRERPDACRRHADDTTSAAEPSRRDAAVLVNSTSEVAHTRRADLVSRWLQRSAAHIDVEPTGAIRVLVFLHGLEPSSVMSTVTFSSFCEISRSFHPTFTSRAPVPRKPPTLTMTPALALKLRARRTGSAALILTRHATASDVAVFLSSNAPEIRQASVYGGIQ